MSTARSVHWSRGHTAHGALARAPHARRHHRDRALAVSRRSSRAANGRRRWASSSTRPRSTHSTAWQVSVQGTQLGAPTDGAGRFRIVGVSGHAGDAAVATPGLPASEPRRSRRTNGSPRFALDLARAAQRGGHHRNRRSRWRDGRSAMRSRRSTPAQVQAIAPSPNVSGSVQRPRAGRRHDRRQRRGRARPRMQHPRLGEHLAQRPAAHLHRRHPRRQRRLDRADVAGIRLAASSRA